jgi:hypothetical protein
MHLFKTIALGTDLEIIILFKNSLKYCLGVDAIAIQILIHAYF